MSSALTLSSATRQNLLSLQGAASLLATTQDRLATGKKVNSALDDPTNFFTAKSLSSRSASLSTLLDGISTGVQTLQAANASLTKLQGLTDQLKSVTQQAQSAANAFTAKATATSTALGGATTDNLLSTGPTQAVSDTALGAGGPAVAATVTGASDFVRTHDATVTGTAYAMPAAATPSTAVGTSDFTTGNRITEIRIADQEMYRVIRIQIGSRNFGDSIAMINSVIASDPYFSSKGYRADSVGSRLEIINNSGSSFSVRASNSTSGFDVNYQYSNGGISAATTSLTIAGTPITISGGNAGLNPRAVVDAALAAINAQTATTGVTATESGGLLTLTGQSGLGSFTVSNPDGSLGFGTGTITVSGAPAPAQTLTVNGTDITIAAGATQAEAIAAINAASVGTGVTAASDAVHPGRIALSGPPDGASFTVQGSPGNTLGFASTVQTVAGTFKPAATSLATALGFRTGDSFTVNGQAVSVAAGETIGSLVQKVGAATGGTVSASFDADAGKFAFTAADAATGLVLGNGSSPTALVSNLGYSVGRTAFAAGLGAGAASALAGTSLTVQVGTGPAATVAFGSAPGQVSSLAQLNAALAGVNAQARLDAGTGKLVITTTNAAGGDELTVTAAGASSPFTSGTTGAILGGDGAPSRAGFVATYNGLLAQVSQLTADAGFNGLNLLAGGSLTLVFNERGDSGLTVQGPAISTTDLGLSAVGTRDFQAGAALAEVMASVNAASEQLKIQASALGANLALVQNRQDFTRRIIDVLDTGAAKLTDAALDEESAHSQALSTRNALGISALALANQSQQGVLQLLR